MWIGISKKEIFSNVSYVLLLLLFLIGNPSRFAYVYCTTHKTPEKHPLNATTKLNEPYNSQSRHDV